MRCLLEFIKINDLHTYKGKVGGRRLAILKNRVPEWNTYYPKLSEANADQLKFYKRWKDSIERGECLDIQYNLAYLFVYMYDLILDFAKTSDYERIERQLRLILEGYSNYEKICSYATEWLSDVYVLQDKYDEAWEIRSSLSMPTFKDYIMVKYYCINKSVSAKQIVSLVSKKDMPLTEVGLNNYEEVLKTLDILLKEIEQVNGDNIVGYMLTKYCKPPFNSEKVNELRELVINNNFKEYKDRNYRNKEELSNKVVAKYTQMISNGKMIRTRHFFNGVSFYYRNQGPPKEVIDCPQGVMLAIQNQIYNMIRDAENIYRIQCGLPKIGEGWVSETELYNSLKEAFSTEVVLSHASPTWLGRQHLDVYFPKYNIAIEYQGVQHDRPVEYFGGEKSFIENQKRDARKKNLCDKNNCVLIYVRPGYDFNILKNQLKELLMCKRRE